MKKRYHFISIFIIPLSLLLYSYHTGSPGGKSNSPGDGMANCTECHTGNSLQSQTGWITSDIPSNGYIPGESYTITATGFDAAALKFGFELTAEDASNNKIGTFSIIDAVRTKFTNSNKAVTHTSNGITPSGGSNSWQAAWVAPEGGTGEVTFYAAFNAANGNGGSSGDQIYTSTYTVSQYVPNPQITSVDPNHAEQGWMGVITILGNETTWSSGVFAVSFLYHDDHMMTFSGTNISVVSDTELTVDVAIPEMQAIGLYDVKVNAVTLENAFTVDVASSIGENLFAKSISTYPNPTKGIVHINLPEGSDFRVIDILGKELYRKSASYSQELVNLSNNNSGYYFIQVMKDGEMATKRVLKN